MHRFSPSLLGPINILLLMARSCYRVSNTVGDGAAIAVSSLFGGANIFVNCFIASFITIPCCRNGVAGCNVVLVIL